MFKYSSINQETGVINWGQGEDEFPEEDLPAPSTRGLEYAVRVAEEERKGLRGFEDLAAAKRCRERQAVIYPDTREETEASRERRRLLRRQEAEARNIPATKYEPIPDMETGVIKWLVSK